MLSKIEVLGTGSKGNAYVLHFDNGTKVQLDAGVKNTKAKEINKLFITHEGHEDHDKFIKDFDCEIIHPSSEPRIEHTYSSGLVPHDKLTNMYLIHEDDTMIGYLTDCGDYNQIKTLKNCDNMFADLDYLFIECNWDYFLIKQGVIQAKPHGERAFSKIGHMSNLDCLNCLARYNIGKDTKIIFVHKSNDHASYDNTYKIFDCLPNKKYVAKKGETLYAKSWKWITR